MRVLFPTQNSTKEDEQIDDRCSKNILHIESSMSQQQKRELISCVKRTSVELDVKNVPCNISCKILHETSTNMDHNPILHEIKAAKQKKWNIDQQQKKLRELGLLSNE